MVDIKFSHRMFRLGFEPGACGLDLELVLGVWAWGLWFGLTFWACGLILALGYKI